MTIDKPRILLLSHYFPAHRGGVEIVAHALATRIVDRFDIEWMAADCDPTPTTRSLSCKPQACWNGLEKFGLPWPIWKPRCWLELYRAISRCDLIHCHDFIYLHHMVALALAKLKGKPVVVTQHIGDIDYRNLFLRWILKAINRLIGSAALRSADAVVFVSMRIKDQFESFTTFPRPTGYLPNGVDTCMFTPSNHTLRASWRSEHGISHEAPMLLFVGRFVERKGLSLVCEIAAARPDWQWCIAGWGEVEPESWALPNVKVFRGLARETLAPLYQAADCLVLPSHGEGFPLVVQEAVACGIPALVSEETARGAPPMPGAIYPVGNSDPVSQTSSWIRAIAARLSARETDAERTRRAEVAAQSWKWEGIANSYCTIFKRAIGSQRHGAGHIDQTSRR